MKAFTSKLELATAYMQHLNNGISEECNKWEDVNQVMKICMYDGLRIALFPQYGIKINAKTTPVIDRFGYVIA